MSALLDEIIKPAEDDKGSLPNLPRKCLRLASELKIKRLKIWAERPPRGREEIHVQLSRLLDAHQVIIREARALAHRASVFSQ